MKTANESLFSILLPSPSSAMIPCEVSEADVMGLPAPGTASDLRARGYGIWMRMVAKVPREAWWKVGGFGISTYKHHHWLTIHFTASNSLTGQFSLPWWWVSSSFVCSAPYVLGPGNHRTTGGDSHVCPSQE